MLARSAHVYDRQTGDQLAGRLRDIPAVRTLSEVHIGDQAMQALVLGRQHRQRLFPATGCQHDEPRFFEPHHEDGLNEDLILNV